MAGAFVEVSLSEAGGVLVDDQQAFGQACELLHPFMDAQGGCQSPHSPYIVLADKGDCEVGVHWCG